MKSDRRSVWFVLLIFILTVVLLYGLSGPRNAGFAWKQHIAELMLSGCFFSFVSLIYFIPRINRLWKVPVYGILVTSLGLLIFGFSTDLMEGIYHGKLMETLISGHYDLSRLRHILTELLVLSSCLNIVPLAVLCPYFYFQKRISQKTNSLPSSGDEASKITFPRNIKLTLFAAAIYIVFIVVYDQFVRPQEGPIVIYNNIPTKGVTQLRSFVLGYVFVLYFISFFSLLISMPSLIGRVKTGIAYCALTPLFWSVTILAVYALLIFFTTWDTEFFRKDIFTLNYYVGRYFDTRAWFISFPLLAIWGFCHWVEAERSKQARGENKTPTTIGIIGSMGPKNE
jgi:uncharacterized membrane protein YqhA